MRLETFFDKFDLFADSPDAVAKMRALVLELAVTGRLVPQDPSDESASTLLLAVEAERLQLVGARKIKLREIPKLEERDLPYGLPRSWKWGSLAQVGYELGQKIPDKRFTYIDVGSIDAGRGRISDRVEVIEPTEAPSRARKLVARGTVIYSTVRPYLLNVAIVEKDFDPEPIASTAFGILHPFVGIANRYLFYWLRSAPFTDYVQASMKGMAYPAINDEKFYSGYIPIPPATEQKRIVAKVDELMALCDRLEAQLQEGETRHAAMASASVARFTETPTPANLDFLFHDAYSIEPADLRRTILTLAVQGKLVSQDPNDESGDAIIARIAREGAMHGVDDEDEFTAPIPLNEHEIPFLLPAAWSWARLGAVADIKHGFAFQSEAFTNDQTPFVVTTPGNFYEEGGFRDRGSKTRYYRGSVPAEFVLQPRDLIMPMTEQAPGLLGSPAFIPDDGKSYLHNQRLGKVIFDSDSICPEFAFWFFNTAFFRGELAKTCTGMKVRHTSPRRILAVPFPICALAEQRRIVAKVKGLIALVNKLEAQIAASRTVAANLLAATFAELTIQA